MYPASTVELPRPERHEAEVWSREDARRFLSEATADRWDLVYRVLLVAGLRRGEVLGLGWDDVDLQVGMLRIDKQLVLVNGLMVAGPPKSRSGHRTLALDPGTVDLLAQAHSPGLSGYVFCSEDGGPLDPAAVSRHFSVLCRRVGVPVIPLHDLRHTSASLGLAAGESLFEVSRRLGHSSIRITGDTYSHTLPEASRRA